MISLKQAKTGGVLVAKLFSCACFLLRFLDNFLYCLLYLFRMSTILFCNPMILSRLQFVFLLKLDAHVLLFYYLLLLPCFNFLSLHFQQQNQIIRLVISFGCSAETRLWVHSAGNLSSWSCSFLKRISLKKLFTSKFFPKSCILLYPYSGAKLLKFIIDFCFGKGSSKNQVSSLTWSISRNWC